jgi:Skp family chaperone for outer membrane proteins
MKRLLGAGGVVLVLALLLVAGRSRSEPQKPPAPHTRVGLINLGVVLKQYEKVSDYTAEMKEEFSRFDKALKERKEQMLELSKKVADKDLSEEEREQVQAELKKLQREMEDSNDKMKALIAKKTDQQMVIVYSDIRRAAERYAKAHDLELVLHYMEGVKEEDIFNPSNVMSKMQQRSCNPLYIAPGLDISAEIVTALNEGYQTEKERSAKKE